MLRKQGTFAFCQHIETELEEDESLKSVLQRLRDMSRIRVRSIGKDLGSSSCPGRE